MHQSEAEQQAIDGVYALVGLRNELRLDYADLPSEMDDVTRDLISRYMRVFKELLGDSTPLENTFSQLIVTQIEDLSPRDFVVPRDDNHESPTEGSDTPALKLTNRQVLRMLSTVLNVVAKRLNVDIDSTGQRALQTNRRSSVSLRIDEPTSSPSSETC